MQLPHTPQSPSQYNSKQSPSDTSQLIHPIFNTLPTPVHATNELSISCDPPTMLYSPDSSKRKRLHDDISSAETGKKVGVEDRQLSIKDLHLDVGKKYRLCTTRKASHLFR